MKALLTNYHQSPRKVRLVADLIRGKSVSQAKAALAFLPKKSSPAVAKLLDSAVANARNLGISTADLFVKKVTVDKGSVVRSFRPFARGRSGTLRKTMSIVSLELATSASKPAKLTAKKHSKLEARS
ncbi:50S ribosomal protein L22 [Candidatus Kaiserbacteria bacterium RIFCSPLOWO2_01_FULL_54_13]|uniref:Large ribosomal subunit protein uL22 n=1 Tax=Candidatus Kaiserbacteria bacterium RIFCSPLOWO2_01_FULL_54_13 TaxID=1798512 RepID=A0A1F6F340_9BACT|nr:MAG: 50S ribosomal protein L22 [Candidatus Kaiserbacteria bacterium RIFCSPLOWO2_01_FULL_54_13]